MKTFNSLLIITVSMLLTACGGEIQSTKDIGENSDIIFDHAKNISFDPVIDFEEGKLRMDAYVDTLFMVRLSEDHLIAEITKMRVYDDRIFIFDERAQTISVFDMEGNFLSAIDRKGKGPGEYVKIADFTLDLENESILILDQFNRKILDYSFSGDFKDETRYTTHARYLGALGDDRYVIYNDYNTRWKGVSYNLFITDEEGEVESHMHPFDDKYRGGDRVKFNYITFHDTSDFHFISHYDNYVYQINKDSTWAKYYFDFGRFNIPDDAIHDSFRALDDYAHNVCDFYETKDFFSFSYVYKRFRVIRYYDKVACEVISWKIIPDNIVYLFSNFPVSTRYGDYFVNYVDAEVYPEFLKKPNIIPEEGPYLNLLDEFREIDEEDNPVLFFFKMKSPSRESVNH